MLFHKNMSRYKKTTVKKSYDTFQDILRMTECIPGAIIKYHLLSDYVDIYIPISETKHNCSGQQVFVDTKYETSGIIFK